MGFLLCFPKDYGAESWSLGQLYLEVMDPLRRVYNYFLLGCVIDKCLEISKRTKYKEIEGKIFSEMYSQSHLLFPSSHSHGSEKGLVDVGYISVKHSYHEFGHTCGFLTSECKYILKII